MTDKKNDVKKETVEQTVAQKIWEEIKDRPMDIYSLPDQKVSDHCSPLFFDPAKLALTLKSTAALPSLETALGKGFSIELATKYVLVTKVAF